MIRLVIKRKSDGKVEFNERISVTRALEAIQWVLARLADYTYEVNPSLEEPADEIDRNRVDGPVGPSSSQEG